MYYTLGTDYYFLGGRGMGLGNKNTQLKIKLINKKKLKLKKKSTWLSEVGGVSATLGGMYYDFFGWSMACARIF